jgi:ribonucleoside-diphosphate reductase alpha chain
MGDFWMTDYEDRLISERYCIEGEKGWSDVVNRIVNAVCLKKDRNEMRDLMLSKTFLPNSPTIMNAGTASGQLSACFVLPVEDSIPSIFDAVKNAAIIHKTGGGTGFSFTKLRPEGSRVKSTNGVASGVVSFIEVFDAATNAIKQGGKRRGANMGVLEYTHPEILHFIKCKRTEGKIKNFNLSVMVDDKFMKEVSKEVSGDITRYVGDNHEIFNEIIEGIYLNGEPGIIFKDAINEKNPNPELGDMVATNPCGEQPLHPNESCNLGSINLSNMLDKDNKVDWHKLHMTSRAAVRFLDAVIDANKYPLPQIEEATKLTRKIGLGVMGFHDMLIKMGIPYDSPEALDIADKVMYKINTSAYRESCVLTGVDEKPKNSTRTTIAPTGTISIIAGVSSGIEPVFSWAYKRKDTTGERIVINPLFEEALKVEVGDDRLLYRDVIDHAMEFGTIQDMVGLSNNFKDLFRGSMDISYENHIKMQASFQRHTNNAVSKTINMPKTATREDIRSAIILAWKLRCKGMTIYRSGSRDEEVLCLVNKAIREVAPQIDTSENIIEWMIDGDMFESITEAVIYKVHSGCGKFYVIIGHDRENPTMVFIEGDGTGGCQGNMAALGRSLSAGLEWGTPADNYVRQFSKVKCNTAMNNKKSVGKSCADIVGKCLNNMITRLEHTSVQKVVAPVPEHANKVSTEPQNRFGEQCCEHPIYIMQEGCRICQSCGTSKCS